MSKPKALREKSADTYKVSSALQPARAGEAHRHDELVLAHLVGVVQRSADDKRVELSIAAVVTGARLLLAMMRQPMEVTIGDAAADPVVLDGRAAAAPAPAERAD